MGPLVKGDYERTDFDEVYSLTTVLCEGLLYRVL